MSIEDTELPVTLEFFMKCTYHEEMVKKIFEARSKGDAGKLQRYLSSENRKQEALRNYYRAFYLDPETRRKCPIRIKPLPKKQRDKLLQYPKNKASNNITAETRNDCSNAGCSEQLAVGGSVKKNVAAELVKQRDTDELMVEDDDAPLGDDEIPPTSTKLNAPMSISSPKQRKRSVGTLSSTSGECLKSQLTKSNLKEQPSPKRLKTGKDCTQVNKTDQKQTETIDNTQNNNDNCVEPATACSLELCPASDMSRPDVNVKQRLEPSTSAKDLVETVKHPPVKSEPSFHFRDLQKLAHYCPVTWSQFKKYTNIMELVSQNCTELYGDSKRHIRYWATKIYMIYYIHPEYRISDSLINKVKVLANCPKNLKLKMVEIPVIEGNNKENVINDEQPAATASSKNIATRRYPNKNEGAPDNVEIKNDCAPNSVEILEDLQLPTLSKKECMNLYTKNPSCKFCQISLEDFITKSNVTFVLEEIGAAGEDNAREMYKQFMQLDEKCFKMLDFSGCLMFTLLKCPNVCAYCTRNWQLSGPEICDKDERSTPAPRVLEERLSGPEICDIDERSTPAPRVLEERLSGPEICDIDERSTPAPRVLEERLSGPEICDIDERSTPASRVLEERLSGHEICDIDERSTPAPRVLEERLSGPEICDIDERLTPAPRVLEESLSGPQTCDIDERSTPAPRVLEERLSGPEICNIDERSTPAPREREGKERYVKERLSGPQTCDMDEVPTPAPRVLEERLSRPQTCDIDEMPTPAPRVLKERSHLTSVVTFPHDSYESKITQADKINTGNALMKVINVNNELCSQFCRMLLDALRVPFDYNLFPVSFKEFKLCSMYKEPLKQIICEFCGPEVELYHSFVKNTELYDSLVLYYYRKFFTNPNLRKKYPLKLKMCPASLRDKMLAFVEATTDKGMQVTREGSSDERQITTEITRNEVIDADLTCLEIGPVCRIQTLAYVLRTSFGLKQRITQTLSELSLQEFKSITHIYEGQHSYDDDKFLQCTYDRVCKLSVWPKSLYIKLEDLLFKLVQSELISEPMTDPTTMLTYISPKFLHWSNLKSTTNFILCVCSDYFHRTGETFDITDMNIVEAECKNYYNRCWSHEQWIGQIPKVNPNLLITLCANKIGDVPIHTVSLQPLIEEVIEQRNANIADIGNVIEDKSQEILCSDVVEDTAGSNDSNIISHKEPKDNIQEEIVCTTGNDNLDNFSDKLIEQIDRCTQSDDSLNDTNYITMPNTQEQIGILPPETIVPDIIDPLEDMCWKPVDECSIGDAEFLTIDEGDVTIKVEMKKPLRCLEFFEDSGGNMQCFKVEEEVVDLDSSRQFNQNDRAENLPPSQIDFGDDEINVNHKSAQEFSGDLISSGSSGSLFRLGQRLPSFCNSNETTCGSQHDTSVYKNVNLQLPDIILSNSGGSDERECAIVRNNEENILETSTTIANVSRVANNLECILVSQEAQRLARTFDTLPTASSTYPPPMVFTYSENSDGNINVITKGKKNETKTTKTDIVPQRTHAFRPLPLNKRGPSSSSTLTAQQVAHTIDNNLPRRSRFGSVTDLEPTVTSTQTTSTSQVLQQTTTSAVTSIDNATNRNKLRTRSSRTTLDTKTCIEISTDLVPAVVSRQTISTFQPQVIPQVSVSKLQASLHQESLRVSQELLRDSSVFNNTSLLRAVDQMSASERPLDVDNTFFNNTSLLRIVDQNYRHPPDMPSTSPKQSLKAKSTNET